jgi:4-carboxymuconolactone decarboxylase
MRKWIAWTSVISLAGAGLAVAALATNLYSSDKEKEPRLPQLTMDQLNDQQKSFASEILKVSANGIAGPYNSLLRSPDMGERMFKLLDYLRFKTSVPIRLNEFAILIQARLWSSEVEWTTHSRLAMKAGLPEAVIAELKQGKRPASMQPDEAAVYDFSIELSTKHEVSDATYKRLRDIFSEQQTVDLITLGGTYDTLAMLLKAQENDVAPGSTPALRPLPAH